MILNTDMAETSRKCNSLLIYIISLAPFVKVVPPEYKLLFPVYLQPSPCSLGKAGLKNSYPNFIKIDVTVHETKTLCLYGTGHSTEGSSER